MNQSEVLEYLKEHGESTVGDIMADTGCSRTAIQQRLQQLHKYGLVTRTEGDREVIRWRAVA